MKRACLVIVAVVASCKFPEVPPIDEVDGAVDAGNGVDAPNVDAPSCTETSCVGGVLEVCGPGGIVESTETCRLGCFSDDRCNWLEPSNGLGVHLVAASGLADVTLPDGVTVDTAGGMIRSGGQLIAVGTDTVAQPGGSVLRVFLATSWVIGDIQVDGALPVAFVSTGNIELTGLVDASADVAAGGPGASACAGSGVGAHQTGGTWLVRRAGHVGAGMYVWSSPGAGGGGFGAPGGGGGDYQPSVGAAGGGVNGNVELVPLRGGCKGGGANNNGGDNGYGGLGGGAVQFVSASGEIIFRGSTPGFGGVHVGGGGGRGPDNAGVASSSGAIGNGTGGGGSGGGVLLEAPSVRFESGAVILAAGGGGGGSGGCGDMRHGHEAPPNGATAGGGACPAEGWGTPAAGGAGAASSAAGAGGNTSYHAAGGGGGGLGRIRINTIDGTFAGEGNAVIRGVLTTGTVQVQ